MSVVLVLIHNNEKFRPVHKGYFKNCQCRHYKCHPCVWVHYKRIKQTGRPCLDIIMQVSCSLKDHDPHKTHPRWSTIYAHDSLPTSHVVISTAVYREHKYF